MHDHALLQCRLEHTIAVGLFFWQGEDAVHDHIDVAVLDNVPQRRQMQHVLQIEQLQVRGQPVLLAVIQQHVALQMHRNRVSRRRVVGHIENIRFAVLEHDFARRPLRQSFLFLFAIGN